MKKVKEAYKGKHQGTNYQWPMSQATKDRKEADKFAGSDPKAGSTIKGRGFDWKKNELVSKIKEALRQLKQEKPGLWANIRAKRARGEKPAHKNSKAHKDAVKAGKKINKMSERIRVLSPEKQKANDAKFEKRMSGNKPERTSGNLSKS